MLEDEHRLSLGMLMHVKCIHELCTLLNDYPHICIIYDVISIFYIDFWGFTNDPLYFGYNPAGQKNHVFNVFDVSGPIRSQMDLSFWGCQYLSTRSIWSASTLGDGPGGPKEPKGRAK